MNAAPPTSAPRQPHSRHPQWMASWESARPPWLPGCRLAGGLEEFDHVAGGVFEQDL
jgi:hypothetical protein